MRFEAFELALQLIAALRPLIVKLARLDKDLARQLRRAASSIPLNLSEGSRRTGGDRLHSFRVAAGSAEEVLAVIKVAIAWQYLNTAETASALELLDREQAITYRLIHGRAGRP